MIRRGLSFALAVSLVSFGLGAIAAQQDKVHLSRKARVGDVSRTLTEATMSAGMDGLMMTMNVKEIDKVTITAVADDGAITARTEAELAEVSVGGQTRPSPPQDPITIVLRPDGSVVSYGDQGFGAIAARMHSGTHIVFAEKPVGVGDSWTRAIKADPATGAPVAPPLGPLLSPRPQEEDDPQADPPRDDQEDIEEDRRRSVHSASRISLLAMNPMLS